MSKLLNNYNNLKKQNSKTLYLFKNGAFYIALEDDAKLLSKEFDLKLTNLNKDAVKCGFPCTSFEKYYLKIQSLNKEFKIIENDTILDANVYIENEKIKNLIKEIQSVDINNLSVSQAYAFIENLKENVSQISKEGK